MGEVDFGRATIELAALDSKYLLKDGTRKMTGNLDMDSNDIVTVNEINGLDMDALLTGWQIAGGTTSKKLILEENSTIDQELKSTGSPTFGGIVLNGSLFFGANASYDIGKVSPGGNEVRNIHMAGSIFGPGGLRSSTVLKMDTAWTHSQDNTQAHSDYLLNDQDDTSLGKISAVGFVDTGSLDGARIGQGIEVPTPTTGSYAFGFHTATGGTEYGVCFDANATGQGRICVSAGPTGYWYSQVVGGTVGDMGATDGTREITFDASAGTFTLTDGTDDVILEVGTNAQITVDDGTISTKYTSNKGTRLTPSATDGWAFVADTALNAGMAFRTGGNGNRYVLTDTAGNQIFQFLLDQNAIIGSEVALATNATVGFLHIPSMAGKPTGTPTTFTGKTAIVYDTTNDALWAYNGSWKSGTFA